MLCWSHIPHCWKSHVAAQISWSGVEHEHFYNVQLRPLIVWVSNVRSYIQGVKCPIYSYIWKTVLYIPIFGRQSYIFLYLEDSPIYSYIWKTVLYIPIFGRQSYIFLYLEDSPIYSYIWKTVLYIPIFQGKQEMLNSYLKQMLLISNMERCKFVILFNR